MSSIQPKTHKAIIDSTRNWISEVVIGLNFCPFARKPFKDETISYLVLEAADEKEVITAFASACQYLDLHPEVETSLLILPNGFHDFEDYLDLVASAEDWLEDEDHEGIYQVASFHPEYLFAGSDEDDPANYTNRSPYPMLHLLREDLLEIAIEKHTAVEEIGRAHV